MGARDGALVAVDVGASSGRVIAARLDGARLSAHEVGRFPNGAVATAMRGRPRLSWDVLGLWSSVRTGLRAAAREHGPVVSLGVDCWAVDYGLLGGDGDLLGNPVHYRDERTAGWPERFDGCLPRAAHYAATGTQVQPFNTVYQLAAEAGSSRMAQAERLLLVPDLLGHWLTGAQVTELTNASTTGLLDVRTGDWSPPVLAALHAATGVDASRLLAPVVAPGTVVGELLPYVTDEPGLRGAHLVTVGSHDTASAVAAVPLGEAPAAYISSGTWSLVGVELDAPVLTEAGRAANFTNEIGVGGTVRYLRNVAGLWLLQESLRTWVAAGRPHDLQRLLEAAADVPALRTVVDVDDPAFVPPGDMPARLREAARCTGQPVPDDEATVVRCVVDSLALAYRRAVRQAAELSARPVEVVHVVGGGARNALLCRLTADAVGLPVVAGPVEATAMGNLLTQALATGALDGGLTAVRQVVRASSDLVRWDPSGPDRPWQEAEDRLAH